MGSYTKIVEFYGIPACGKSTLCRALVENSTLKASLFSGIPKEAQRNLLKFILSISLYDLYLGVRFWFLIPASYKREDVSILRWLRFLIYYRFVRKYSNYDIVFVEHGLIQYFVAFRNGFRLDLNSRLATIEKKLLIRFRHIVYVYCRIDAAESLIRMQKRGRSSGKVDMIKDKIEQLNELQYQESVFDIYQKELYSMNMMCNEIDTSLDVKSEVTEFWPILQSYFS